MTTEQRIKKRARARAFNLTIIIIATVVAVAACIYACYSFSNKQSAKLEQIQSELAGDVLTCREKKNTGGIFGTNYYAFHRLKFNDDGTLDYYYATASIHESALPKYKNTYNYAVTISMFGVCQVKFSNYVFTLKLNDNGQVEGISGVSY